MATITRIRMAMRTPMDEGAIFDVLSWMSPAWPVGAYTHSGGLEWAVEEGHVTDRTSCERWLADLLAHGTLFNEAVLFVHAHRAAVAGDAARLGVVAELALAAQSGAERFLETTAQGNAFARIARSASTPSNFAALLAPLKGEDLAYPLVAATLFACHGVPEQAGLTAFLHGTVSNYVSAAQRLVPLGQTDGQRAILALRPRVLDLAAQVVAGCRADDPFDDLAGCSLLAEIGCMAHETQYTRLFRT